MKRRHGRLRFGFESLFFSVSLATDYETRRKAALKHTPVRPALGPDPDQTPPAIRRFIGYARVSTNDQTTALQLDALRRAGCAVIHEDKVSGTSRVRDGLDQALASVQPGDKLVVWRLDRLGRSIPHITAIVADLADRGASLVSLCEAFDTGTESGELYSTILAMIAHVERRMIVSRTRAGLQAAKDRGVRLGAKPKMTSAQAMEAKALMASDMKAEAVAARYAVSRATLFRHMAAVTVQD